jgi:hypothetical protein
MSGVSWLRKVEQGAVIEYPGILHFSTALFSSNVKCTFTSHPPRHGTLYVMTRSRYCVPRK